MTASDSSARTGPARSPLVILITTVFIDLIGFGIIIPILPFYAEEYGASPTAIGVLIATYSIMQFLFSPVWGALSDRVGRKPIIVFGLAGASVGYIVFGLAHSLAVLFAARALAGVAGANIATAQAYVADVTAPDERARGMGLIGAAFGLGFILGPAFGGLLSDPVVADALRGWGVPWMDAKAQYRVPLLFAGTLAALNAVSAVFLLPEPTRAANAVHHEPRSLVSAIPLHPGRFYAALTMPRVGLLLGVVFLTIFALANMEATFALFAEHIFHFTVRSVSFVLVYVGVIGVVLQGGLIGKLTRRFGEARLALTGAACLGVGLAAAGASVTSAMLIAAMGVLAIGRGLITPSLNSLISRMTATHEQGRVLGMSQSFSSLGRVFGPLCGGWVYDIINPSAPFYAGGAIMAIVFLTLSGWKARTRDTLESSADSRPPE